MGCQPYAAADPMRKEKLERLKKLPVVPTNWRAFVDPRIAEVASMWRWTRLNLVLLGHTGCGKTLAAAALARRLIAEAESPAEWRRARRLTFVDAARLALAREQCGLGQGEAPLIDRCLAAPLLVIDELGFLDKGTGVIEQVVDQRNKHRLPMVVTSGMTPPQLEGRYGTATARKLMEGARMVQVFCK